MTGSVLTLKGFLSWRKALTFSNEGLLPLVGDYPIKQLVLSEKEFGWMALWKLNPEVLGLLSLMATATWGGGGKSLRLNTSMIGEGGPCPFRIIPWYLPYK
jgi:hypothetical protein